MKLTLARTLAGLLLLALVAAKESSASKYKVVTSLEALNRAADQGYRLLLSGPFSIVEREATPPDTYRYMAFAVGKRPRPKEFLNFLNNQGALGYRLIYQAGILEKAPHPRNYEYALGGGPGLWSQTPNLSGLPSLVAQGYRFMGAVYFDAVIGQGTNDSLLLRELDAQKPPGAGRWKVAVADARRAGNVLKDMNELAKQGYRYLAPHVSDIGGGYAVSMETCIEECGAPYEYRELKVEDLAQINRQLNAEGSAGFRFVPHSPYFMQLLERATGQTEIFKYLVFGEKSPSQVEQLLKAADADGYVPVGFVSKGQRYLVLERVLNVPSTP